LLKWDVSFIRRMKDENPRKIEGKGHHQADEDPTNKKNRPKRS
jgi:hypothetical protein